MADLLLNRLPVCCSGTRRSVPQPFAPPADLRSLFSPLDLRADRRSRNAGRRICTLHRRPL